MSQPLRILLVQLGHRDPVHPFTSPPLGLMYLAAYLRAKSAVDIRIICQEVDGCSNGALVKTAVDYSPDIVGLSCMTPYAQDLPEITLAMRAAMPKVRIILGGPHISAFREQAFEFTAADAAVIGEGELTFEMFIEAVKNASGLDTIPGLLWRDEQGSVIVNAGNAPIIEELDSLPVPAYDLIDLSKYWRVQSMPPIPTQHYISLLSSRGCPYGCIWCHNIFGRHFRAHSPQRMVEEVKQSIKRYHINEVEFMDDCFNLKRSRVVEFSDLLLKECGRVNLAFPNALRTDILDQTVVEALVEAGMFFTCLALESASPRIQHMTKKNLDIQKFLKGVELVTARKVFTQGFMMLGFPGETGEEMQTTIDVAANSKLHLGSFFMVTPYPNTPIYEYAKDRMSDQGGMPSYSSMDFLTSRINMSAVSDAEIVSYLGKAMRTFYFRPERILRICRDFPQRHLLYKYAPLIRSRILKGFIT